MELALENLPFYKRWWFKFLSFGLIPGIYSIIAFGYIGIPTNIQEMVRRRLPYDFRTTLLDFWSLEEWFTVLFITAFVCAIWSGLGGYVTRTLLKETYHRIHEKNEKLLEENQQLQEKNDSNAINCYELFSRYIFNNYFSKFELTSDERISLYKMDLELFLCVGRHSDNERYKTRPTRLYPRNAGCIEKIWQTGYFEDVNPYDPEKDLVKWKQYNIDNFSLDNETLDKIKMKSRALQGFRIQNSQMQTIAVLVFESINPDGLKLSRIKNAMTPREKQNLCHLLESLESHMPSLEMASSEGF
ncbi:hypothetical protein V9R51_003663 [Vibrio cholerae]|uniref:hypothetical protein n=3 Tax=Vibrio cholerae TaxID=666 RepID=UPI000E0AD1C5|nr:hypothetical protein [Vibrio cholerae]EGQ8122385.1 hypothetical protein [Vibrio cholerae]EKF9854009.1 hypothetical protein [Vibrio cholerae]MBJ6915182.1 hypothetical protein [Vibrio cholerae]MBJ6918888.1 hypothetical protein [Vibrio cholerae]MBJ6930380.1 hypothetical protein [Vibrio cholerae]